MAGGPTRARHRLVDTLRVRGLGVVLVALLAVLSAPAAAAPAHAAASPSGSPVTGGDSVSGARLISPGQYVDRFAHGSDTSDHGSIRYYAVDLSRGDTPYLSATLYPPSGRHDDSLEVTVAMTAPNSKDCDVETSESATPLGDVVAPVSAVLAPGEVGGQGWPADCPTGGRFVFAVARSGPLVRGSSLSAEIALRIEPPATTAGLPGAATGSPAPASLPAASGDGGRVEAGDGYDDATLLRPGPARTSVTTGTVGFYRVHLGWGQRLAVRMRFGTVAGQSSLGGVEGTLAVSSPLRAPLSDASRGGDVDGSATALGKDAGELTVATTYPVRYTNREGPSSGAGQYSIDGDYYLSLVVGHPFDTDARDFSLPVTIAVAVSGSTEPPPAYGARSGPVSAGQDAGGFGSLPLRLGIAAVVVLVVVLAVVVGRRRRSGRRQARRHT